MQSLFVFSCIDNGIHFIVTINLKSTLHSDSFSIGLQGAFGLCGSFFVKQPVDQVERLDAVVGMDVAPVHRQYDFFVVVGNHPERAKLAFPGFG